MFKKNKKLVLTSLAAIALLTTGGLASATTQVVNAAIPETHSPYVHEDDDISILGDDDYTSRDGIVHQNPDGSYEVVSFRGVVKTNKDNVQLYALNDSTATKTDRSLALNTTWKSDKSKTIAGVVYYRVSTNEWVKSDDVTISGKDVTKEVIGVSEDGGASVYNIKNNKMTLSGKVLDNDTSWLTGAVIIIDGTGYFQISPNEWLIENSIFVY